MSNTTKVRYLLGWIEKDRKGWVTTKLGKSLGGKQTEHNKTGVPYVKWPETILKNKRLVETIEEIKEGSSEPKMEKSLLQNTGLLMAIL